MKKKLEADLISIAHRILKLKNKSDINQLYLETQKLYEKLTVLKFVDENFDSVKPTIGRTEVESTIEIAFKNDIPLTILEETIEIEAPKMEAEVETISETIKIETPEVALKPIEISETEVNTETETIVEAIETPILETIEEKIIAEIETPAITAEVETELEVIESAKPLADFKPAFEFTPEEPKDEVVEAPKKPEVVQISFEDLMGINYSEAQFVKVDEIEVVATPKITEFKEKAVEKIAEPEIAVLEAVEPKKVSLNDKLSRGIHIDLNDRLAFIKHLFGNNPEDYNRVYNQLITFDTYAETKEFIEQMVKPDYNNWNGKEDYEYRFFEIIEKKFL